MRIYRLTSNAKINLNLNVIAKLRSKNLHSIESLIAFVKLSDSIKVEEIVSRSHMIIFKGKFSKGISKRNSISNLLNLLDQKNLLEKKKYKIIIKKNIPQKSGMGGGSMNAACILSFFYKRGILNLNQVNFYSKKIGSDVILGLNNKPKILFSNGKTKEIKKSIKYSVLLVKPSYGCSTKNIYSINKTFSKKQYNLNKNIKITDNMLVKSKNDLEVGAFKKYPRLKALKNKLLENQKAEFVRMTGSGSTLVVYFKSQVSAKNAFKIYKRKLNNCWCFLSKII